MLGIGCPRRPNGKPQNEKSFSPLPMGSTEGELLVRLGGHVPGSDPAGQGDVLGIWSYPNETLQNSRLSDKQVLVGDISCSHY
jgi:hypothetical protein